LKKVFCLTLLFIPLFSYCQIKLSYDTSKLINGTGVAVLVSNTGKNFGFATYKNNNWDGEFCLIDTLEQYALKGILRYDTTCINYTPGVKVKYLDNTDPVTMVLDSALFIELFKYRMDEFISTEPAMAPPLAFGSHPDLYMGFYDQAVVPIGKWQRFNLKEGFIFTEYTFDDCGNILLSRYFNPDGSVLAEHKYDKRPKKKKFW
jgi:hypothetical protein